MDAADLCQDPHVLARDMIISVMDKELGPVRMQGIVPKFSETPGEVRHAGQPLGASNREVYTGLLGLPDSTLRDLETHSVI